MTFDVAVVGAGILGLAHAYHLARQGKRVVVLERGARALGASVRNFGMIWPIGQPAGERYSVACRSREIWLDILEAAGLWHERAGSLHLAYADDEARVLQEFLARAPADGFDVAWREPKAVLAASPGVRPEGLRGGMWSPGEVCVDPRAAIAALPAFLTERFGVAFRFGCQALGFEGRTVRTSEGAVDAAALVVCAGADIQTLYPEALRGPGMTPCKLQMMRTVPQPPAFRLGPLLAAGLTLRHYESFRTCPSLPALAARFAAELPDYERWGIHVLVSQNGAGELTLGDSHEYGEAIEPFSRDEIDALVLKYLASFFVPPAPAIASRWQGVYLKHPSAPWFIARPEPRVTLVTGVGGAGMTLSFGLAERVVEEME